MGTVADKLTYLNETKDKIKYSINLTGAGITNEDTFRSYAVKLRDGLVDIINNGTDSLYNNFPKVSGSGSEITLEDTLEAPMYIDKLNGDTFQQTYSGKNKFNPALLSQVSNYNTYDESTGLWNTNSGSGYFRSIFYSATGSSSNRDITKLVKLQANITYTIKFYDFVNNSSYSSNPVECALFDSNGEVIDGTYIGTNVITFTTTQVCYLDIRRRSSSGYLTFSKIQIEEGSSPTDFELYVGGQTSPNPDYPQDIKCVTGTQTVEINGENNTTPITDATQLVYDTDFSVVVGDKNTLSATGNMQKFIDNGTNDNQWYFWRDVTNDRIYYSNRLISSSMNDYYAVVLNNEYAKFEYNNIGVTYNKANNSSQRRAFVFLCEGDLPYLPNSSSSGTSTFSKWKMRSNTIIIDTQFLYSSYTNKPTPNVYYYKTDEIWSYSGDMYYSTDITEGANEVYFRGSKDWNLDLNGTKYCSKKFALRTYTVGLGTIKLYDGDYITGTPDNWSIVRNMQEAVFDGSSDEAWNFYSTSAMQFRIELSDAQNLTVNQDTPPNVKCNRYTPFAWNLSTKPDYGVTSTVSKILSFRNVDITSLNNWKTALSTNNLTVIYPLAEPTTTPITNTTLIGQLNDLYNSKSRDGKTYITVSGNLPVILDVNILKDEL